MNIKNKSYIYLIVVAFLFGFSYVFQSEAANYVGPFTFGFLRYLLASLCLLPFSFKKDKDYENKKYLKGGFILALTFLAASGAQQIAAGKTASGKIGFITSMYIVLVPICESIIFKKKLSKGVIASVIMATVGLGLLCGITNLQFNGYDFLVLITAVSYALEIIYIDRVAYKYNQYKLMFYAFIISSMLFLIVGFFFEGLYISDVSKIIIPVAYLGIFAGAIGYCLQVVGQKKSDSTIASILMSLESVVSILAGIIFLSESFTLIQLIGCVLMFTSAILCIVSNS